MANLENKDQQYAREFTYFLQHTNQKYTLASYLKELVCDDLKTQFVDVGAGDGSITNIICSCFDRTLAIEPNSCLSSKLSEKVSIVASKIEDVQRLPKSDFILFSHVSYYFQNASIPTIVNLVCRSLMASGLLCVVVQDESSNFTFDKAQDDSFVSFLLNTPIFYLDSNRVIKSSVTCDSVGMERISLFFREALNFEIKVLKNRMDCSQRVFIFKKSGLTNTAI
uniref:DREV methyltransferase n=1 Tax=Candidatus Kentrum sp. LFY TaxID=2126342 RepID=A0A450WHP0_9GAMM|nr:MAG: DREV methyltransferase [Candidatus Kentron sp. LFY]